MYVLYLCYLYCSFYTCATCTIVFILILLVLWFLYLCYLYYGLYTCSTCTVVSILVLLFLYLFYLYCNFYTCSTCIIVFIVVLLVLLTCIVHWLNVILFTVDLYSTPIHSFIHIYIHSLMLYYLAYKGRTVMANLFSPVLLLMCFSQQCVCFSCVSPVFVAKVLATLMNSNE